MRELPPRAQRFLVRALLPLVIAVASFSAGTALASSQTGPKDLAIGRNVHRGNLLAMQPFLKADDFRTEAKFYRKLEKSLLAAKRHGWLNTKTVVVFPEQIGFYLFAVDEPDAVYRTKTLNEAAMVIAQTHAAELKPPSIPMNDPLARGRRMVQDFKAKKMARVYQTVFSRLARTFHVTVVAGSITLPEPSVRHGKLIADLTGPIRNAAAVFRPSGEICPDLVMKSFPTSEEAAELGVTRGSPDQLPVFQTPAGKLGVIVCADSWYPATYRVLNAKGAKLLAVVSHIGDRKTMSQPWQGYNLSPGLVTPGDVDPSDPGRLKEGEAWIKYALPGRMGRSPLGVSRATNGVNLFIRGRLWEHDTPGALPLVVRNGRFVPLTSTKGGIPSMVTLWLE